jgi:O-antigen biosynthesis protein
VAIVEDNPTRFPGNQPSENWSRASAPVTLVIPVRNQFMHTMQCLESIQRMKKLPYEIVVVDNGSTDSTAEYLKSPPVQVITNWTDFGHPKAWNQGIRAAGGDVIGILDNDIVVTPGWLSAVLNFMERTGCGIVSPAMREGPLDYDLHRHSVEFTAACGNARRQGFPHPCMLIEKRVFDQIGLFDEAFSSGRCARIDFLWRARKAGIRTAVTGAAFIHHFAGTEKTLDRSVAHSKEDENLRHFRRKWGRTVQGNWLQRGWSDVSEVMTKYYEQIRYGHVLVEWDWTSR